MTPGAIGRRYGRALFELATEAGQAGEVAAGLAELATAIESLEPGLLASGSLSPAQREQLTSALVKRIGAETLMGRFVGVLAAADRLQALPAVRASFEKFQDAAAGQVRVVVRSATPLPDAERAALRSKFEKITGRRVLDTAEVDADLLGGVTVEAEGRVYDGSVRTLLARLERQMAGQAG